MEQPWYQQREGGGDYAANGEICHAADLDQAMTTDLCEVDGALLMMELMDQDLPSSDLLLDGDVGRQLSHVIRSLEAEIGGESGEAAAMTMADDGGGESMVDRIEDVLSDDMDGYGYGYGYDGASSFFAAGHDEAEGWCVYANGYEGGSVLGYDDTTVDHHQYYYCYAEGSAEHMYLPLWE